MEEPSWRGEMVDAAEQDVAALDQKLAKLQSSYAARRAKAVEKASVAPTAERRAKLKAPTPPCAVAPAARITASKSLPSLLASVAGGVFASISCSR